MLAAMIRKCAYCGQDFNRRRNENYCCKACRDAYTREKIQPGRREAVKKPPQKKVKEYTGKNDDLTRKAIEAKVRGMSYAKYSALLAAEKEKEKQSDEKKNSSN